MPKSFPDSIGRFRIIKELGKGSQGVVYLAVDPNLDRQVAIKTLRLHLSGNGDKKERMLREARTVSKLQHPNIIPVYEAGEHEDQPYLVFEYVDGVSIRDLIRSQGGLVIHRAVKLMRQILDGIAYAHQQGVVHRDISPSNILVDKNDIPRIMDFGISIVTGAAKGVEKETSGTPCYMSPEHFSKQPIGPASDIFSLGLVFFEMLVGRPAILADDTFAAMYKIAHDPIPPPSSQNQTVDSKLDAIVLKALAKTPDSRYPDAPAMKKDLDDYLSPDEPDSSRESNPTGTHVTLDFLLRRMRHKSDFPTFSQYIAEINQKTSIRDRNVTSASQLANVIIKDYALTNKLLKLVNSAFYGQTSGAITTVSRAVVIMGFEQVRLATAGLMLFDHLQNKSQRAELEDAAISSFMSALIARDLAEKVGFFSTEEAFICAMLHRLGKHLVIFYFPEEFEQAKTLMVQKDIDEDTACRSVLGISYEELGDGVARTWRFPEKILRSMRSLPQGRSEKPASEEDMLCTLSNFSNELCQIAGSTGGEEGEKALASILKRFEGSLSISKDTVCNLLESAKEKIETYSGILNINTKKSRFLSQVAGYSRNLDREASTTTEPAPDGEREELDSQFYHTLEIPDGPSSSDGLKDPQSILINGIQEITNSLLEDYEINDVITMILETMYRGFGFNHVLFCIMDRRRARLVARFGFGEGIDKIIEGFQFPVNKKEPDVFNLALSLGKDIGIDDARDPRLKRGLPEWYLQIVSAPAFVLCPIILNKLPIGLVYADRDQSGQVMSGNHIKYMKTLCSQAVLAMKQMRNRA